MKILDTTFLIDMIRGREETLPLAESGDEFLTTEINMYEVINGFFLSGLGSKSVEKAIPLFKNIRVLGLTDNAIIRSAEVYADLMKRGHPMSDTDCLIAGIALSNNVDTIVTKNTKHFSKIKGLKVESY